MEFYRCKKCGKIVAIVKDHGCPTICCGEPMSKMEANTQDGAREKHLPVYEVKDHILYVKIGEVPHPMMEEHHIEWIAVHTNKGNKRVELKAGDAPEAMFALLEDEVVIEVFEYCNLHGLYKA